MFPKKIFLCLLLLLPAGIFAQVLNVESLRFLNDTDGWMGQVRLSFAAENNGNEVYNFGNTVHVQYKKGRSRLILLNNLDLEKANGEDFINTGYQHVRYNYRLGDDSPWTAEAFVQSQYNKPMKMDFRGCAGVGPRYRLFKRDNFHCYLAALYMYEHEIDDGGRAVYDDHRLDSYLSFSWKMAKNLEIVNTVYYQPLFADFNDYRISEDFIFTANFTKHFGIGTVFGLLKDTKQPPGVPELSWHFGQSLTYAF